MLKKALSLIATSTLFSSLAHSDAMVWKVSNEHGELYLGGTIHMLRPTDYPLNSEYDIAFNDSDLIVFETDISATMDMGFQQKMMMQMSLPPGKSLETLLQPATYKRLSQFAQSRGLPIETLNNFKPAMVILTLTVMELKKLGMTVTSGMETYFSAQARKHNKPVASLETPDEQLSVLTSMGDGYEDTFVNGSLDDFERLETEFTELIKAWRNGDTKTIDTMMTSMMKERFPDMYNTLLVKRNFNWISQIGDFIKTPETEFILVGAAHLAGNDSVQNLLKAQGYTVKKVSGAKPIKKTNIR